MDVAKRFAANLVQARKAAGISQEELGFRASLHRTQIGILERGIRLPRIDTLVRLGSGRFARPTAQWPRLAAWHRVAGPVRGGGGTGGG